MKPIVDSSCHLWPHTGHRLDPCSLEIDKAVPCFQPPHLCHLSAQVLLGSLDSVIVGTKPERRLTQGSCFGFLLASVALSTLHWQCVGFILLSHLVIALLFSQVSEVKIGRNIHCFALQDNSLEHTEPVWLLSSFS